MGKPSRDKGKRGERELVPFYKEYDFEVERNANQAHTQTPTGLYVKGDLLGIARIHIEVKRQETIQMPAWIAQAVEDAGEDLIPIIHFRRSKPKVPWQWWTALPLENYLPMLRAWVDLQKLRSDTQT